MVATVILPSHHCHSRPPVAAAILTTPAISFAHHRPTRAADGAMEVPPPTTLLAEPLTLCEPPFFSPSPHHGGNGLVWMLEATIQRAALWMPLVKKVVDFGGCICAITALLSASLVCC